MRLVMIYCSWGDSTDLLAKSIANHKPVVDGIIVVYSDFSYRGEFLEFPLNELPQDGVRYVRADPSYSETDKRNLGLNEARRFQYTDFILADNDEFYRQEDVRLDRLYLESNPLVNGLVCRVKVLFAKPTLTCDDHTLVLYIHKLTSRTKAGNFRNYPFAYDENGAHIDPTRRLNYEDGIQMSDTIMYHASWIRKDFELKIANSPAVRNLRKSTILEDLKNAAPGYYCKFYRKTLHECENIFNL